MYRTVKGHGLVTLAVQKAEFAKAKANLQQAAKVDLGSRTGLCGQYGQPTLYAPLSHGRMLTVAAPCGVAKRFAARAVQRAQPLSAEEAPPTGRFMDEGPRPWSSRTEEDTMKIGVVGLGYVGVPLAVAFCEAGHTVIGVDADRSKIEALTRGESYIEDIPDARLREVLPRLQPTVRYAELSQADAVIIAVPTPLTPNREPDLGPLTSSATALATVLQRGQLVVLESTTYPGYTRERLVPLLEESGLAAGSDFNVAFSPERVDPGRKDYTLRTTAKVVGGSTPACLERAVALYGEVCDHVVPGLDDRRGRAHEAPGEHLPLGQHRARQRDRDPLRPHGHRCLGGRQRGLHEALRLHALRAGAGHGRALPAG